jgi:guanine nucleotide-binding protein subunit beta-2-like 1 protein
MIILFLFLEVLYFIFFLFFYFFYLDRTLCVWTVDKDNQGGDFLRPKKILTGHNHIIEDVCLSADGQYALTASWDKTLRLWDLNSGSSIARFKDHTHDVLSVSLSRNNRQIISGGRDKTIRLWNIYGDCKFITPELQEWITCVKFGLSDDNSPIISTGYDRNVRVWDRQTFQQKYALTGHTGYVNTLSISPDCTLVASGGHDQVINLFDIPEGKFLYSLPAGDIVNSLVFSPNHFWLAAGTDSGLKIFCLNQKKVIYDIKYQPHDLEEEQIASSNAAPEKKKRILKLPKCRTVTFSADGAHLHAGFSDGYIRTWNIPPEK